MIKDRYESKELFSYLSLSYDIIPIGLYRRGKKDSFVFTNPSQNVLLKDADKVYVLAGYEPMVN